MSKRLFSGITALVVTASVAAAQTRPMLPTHIMDSAIRAQVDSGFAGVVLVADRNRVVLRRAYGRGEHRPTETSAFWIASITKSFTAAAILALQKEGRVSVHDSLYRFFPDAPADKRTITIDQLLTHTAGFDSRSTSGGLVTRASAVRAILGERLAYVPGRAYAYGDSDYELLAAVVEVASGLPWQNFVQRRVLNAVGLRHTGFWCDPWRDVPRPLPAANRTRTQCALGHFDWAHRGANGMSATADDLLKWASELWYAGRGASRFSSITIPRVFVRREEPFDVYYGYGVRLYVGNKKVAEVVHSGSGDDGHTAIVRQLASGLTIVVLSNAGQHKGTTWSSYVATRLASREP